VLDSPTVAHRAGGPGRKPVELDAATLILELDMAALIGAAGDSLRQHRDVADRREPRSWWRRLLGKVRIRQAQPSRQGTAAQ